MANHVSVFQLGLRSALPYARRSALPSTRRNGRVSFSRTHAAEDNTTEAGTSVAPEKSTPASNGGTIFFAGKAYTDAEVQTFP